MARQASRTRLAVQSYPRIENPNSKEDGFLDEKKLVKHITRVPIEDLPQIILTAIENANKKSSRAMLLIPANITDQERARIYQKIG